MKKNLLLFVVVLMLGIAAWHLYSNRASGTLADKPLSDFTIEDTAAISKIVITDHFGRVARIERIPGNHLWRLNDKYYAREDAVETLLKTFKRIRVRGNVSDGARDNMMKLLATSGKRAEIYMGGDKPAKIYYVGVATPDHTGTHMLLEIPGVGRSEEPYITHMEGFTGFLSTRFFTDEQEWRFTGVYNYPKLDISSIKMIDYRNPAGSFEVRYQGGNEIQLYGEYDPEAKQFDKRFDRFDSLAIKVFLLDFKRLHVESYQTYLNPAGLDSLSIVEPAYSLIVTENGGKVRQTDLYLKPAAKDAIGDDGNPLVWDVARFWARTPEGEFAVVQTFNFGPLVAPVQAYLPTR